MNTERKTFSPVPQVQTTKLRERCPLLGLGRGNKSDLGLALWNLDRALRTLSPGRYLCTNSPESLCPSKWGSSSYTLFPALGSIRRARLHLLRYRAKREVKFVVWSLVPSIPWGNSAPDRIQRFVTQGQYWQIVPLELPSSRLNPSHWSHWGSDSYLWLTGPSTGKLWSILLLRMSPPPDPSKSETLRVRFGVQVASAGSIAMSSQSQGPLDQAVAFSGRVLHVTLNCTEVSLNRVIMFKGRVIN